MIAYLEAENAYTEARTAHLGDLREAVFDEIKARTQETDLSVPIRKGNWWLVLRAHRGGPAVRASTAAAPVARRRGHARRSPSDGEPLDGEQVLLDGNELAAGTTFFSLGACRRQPGRQLLAYSTDFTGDERFTAAGQGPGHRGAAGRRDARHASTACAWSARRRRRSST